MLKSLWSGLTSFLNEPNPGFITTYLAAGVRGPLMRALMALQARLSTLPDRLLILLTLIAFLLIGAWLIYVI